MFEEAMKYIQEAEAQKARDEEVQRIFQSTSSMVWDALPNKSRSYDNDISSPDAGEINAYYGDAEASHDDEYYAANAATYPGPEYRREKLIEDSRWTATRANQIEENCIDINRTRAEVECAKGQLPNGPVPEGLPPEECMQFWAEGVNDETFVNSTTKAKTDTIKRTLEGGAEIVVPEVGKAGYKASDETANATTSTESGTSTRLVKGSEGYLAQCRKMESDWFNQQTALMPYSD